MRAYEMKKNAPINCDFVIDNFVMRFTTVKLQNFNYNYKSKQLVGENKWHMD